MDKNLKHVATDVHTCYHRHAHV